MGQQPLRQLEGHLEGLSKGGGLFRRKEGGTKKLTSGLFQAWTASHRGRRMTPVVLTREFRAVGLSSAPGRGWAGRQLAWLGFGDGAEQQGLHLGLLLFLTLLWGHSAVGTAVMRVVQVKCQLDSTVMRSHACYQDK